MMAKVSAGLLMYRILDGHLEVLLAHPGGPYFARKDDGYWTIPKGEVAPGEDALAAACREFEEEIGVGPTSPFLALGSVKQRSGKLVHVWACAWGHGPKDLMPIRSNEFEMEWPPKSGQMQRFPEIDQARFMRLEEARCKIMDAQKPLLGTLEDIMSQPTGGATG